MQLRILVVGDIVGRGGRKTAGALIPQLRREYNCCFCIANGENSAGGAGLTSRCVDELQAHGVDVITSGDHIWDQREFLTQIDRLKTVLRPANFKPEQPGRGHGVFTIPIGGTICVINLIGRVFIDRDSSCPFAAVDRILAELKQRTPVIIVDMHAEATSEKLAMARHLDGRVTAVFGTHTHVATADACVLPGGTAYITDLGMVGSSQSILGRDIEAVLKRFTTGLPTRLKVVDRDIVLNGAVIEFDADTGRASSIVQICRPG